MMENATMSPEQIINSLKHQRDCYEVQIKDLETRIENALGELAAIKCDVRKLHRRKCWGCGETHWHADDRTPGVLCPECGSQDTRRAK